MLLRPRKFLHKNIHKRRTFRFFRKNTLVYGQFGLKLLQPVRLTNTDIFKYKLLLKKGARKTDKTLRKVWFNIFPHLPLTRKIEGARMGKGKGKLVGWCTELPAGINLFEFRNLRIGRAIYFSKQIKYRLAAKCRFCSKFSLKTTSPLNVSKKICYETFW